MRHRISGGTPVNSLAHPVLTSFGSPCLLTSKRRRFGEVAVGGTFDAQAWSPISRNARAPPDIVAEDRSQPEERKRCSLGGHSTIVVKDP
jgi:hypothetical protein